MRRLLLIPFLLAGCGGPSATSSSPVSAPGATAPVPPALEGSTWKIAVEPVEAPGEKPFSDRLRFDGERHAALESFQGRFGAASYNSGEAKDGALPFDFKLSSPEGGTLSVSGKAALGLVWGTLTWRRADWTLATYRFRGGPD